MRFLRIVIIVLALIVVVLLLYSGLQRRVPLPGKVNLPVDLQSIIPSTWSPILNQYKTCDFDGDGENEYLIIYSYDLAAGSSALPPTVPTPSVVSGRSLIGGVIYDTQANRVAQSPGTEAPFRPAFLIPYRLLPDMYGGKGQGYLGQNTVTVHLLPGLVDNKCQAREIVILGTSFDAQPTNLSIFRWQGEPVGYIAAHFQGSARVQAYATGRAVDPTKPTVEVLVYNELNQRSLLCAVQRYARWYDTNNKEQIPPGLDFAEIKTDYTIDFCYGPPKDPTYPEGVVMALLRGQNPNKDSSPTGLSYFKRGAIVPSELGFLTSDQRLPVRVLSVASPGSLGLHPPQGMQFIYSNPATPSPTPEVWWESTNTAPVDTEIVLLNGETRQVHWTLVSMANERASGDLLWRITQVELR